MCFREGCLEEKECRWSHAHSMGLIVTCCCKDRSRPKVLPFSVRMGIDTEPTSSFEAIVTENEGQSKANPLTVRTFQ